MTLYERGFFPNTRKTKSDIKIFRGLRDCPCCGGEAKIFREDFGKTVWVGCVECGLSTARYEVEIVVDNKNGFEWAVSIWNRRR